MQKESKTKTEMTFDFDDKLNVEEWKESMIEVVSEMDSIPDNLNFASFGGKNRVYITSEKEEYNE